MERVRNWDVKLAQWAKRRLDDDFEWGRTDCGKLVLKEAFEVMYGEEVFDDLPGWTTKVGAVRASTKIGDIVEYLKSHGAEEIDRAFLRDGDIIIERGEAVPNLAIVVPISYALIPNESDGITQVSIHSLDENLTFMRYNGG